MMPSPRRKLFGALLAVLICFRFSGVAHGATDTQAKIDAIRSQIKSINEQKAALDAKIDAQVDPEQRGAANLLKAKTLPPDEYMRAKVLSVEDKGMTSDGLEQQHSRTYHVSILTGPEKGKELAIVDTGLVAGSNNRIINSGDVVAVVKSYQLDGSANYYLADNYRLPPLIILAVIFFLLAVAFGGIRGFTSVLGLAASIAVIMGYIVPKILAGSDPMRVTLVGTLFIAAVSLYLAHGFNKRTTIAFVGTIVTLGLSALLAVKSVAWARFYGTGSEEAIFLQNGDFGSISLRGLLLGGIMLGVLGVLDDITTAQSAVVDELKKANPKLTFRELYARGLSVGREHIASLVNTLFLAYAGVALPLFLLFAAYKGQPLWFIMNNEIVSEEIIRTLVGSVCLILAVPITTALAAFVFADPLKLAALVKEAGKKKGLPG